MKNAVRLVLICIIILALIVFYQPIKYLIYATISERQLLTSCFGFKSYKETVILDRNCTASEFSQIITKMSSLGYREVHVMLKDGAKIEEIVYDKIPTGISDDWYDVASALSGNSFSTLKTWIIGRNYVGIPLIADLSGWRLLDHQGNWSQPMSYEHGPQLDLQNAGNKKLLILTLANPSTTVQSIIKLWRFINKDRAADHVIFVGYNLSVP